MAKSSSFFGLRKGSTKSLTFSVLDGKQITKDRVYNVKNPQTLAQMQQRALMATAVSAYSSLKAITDHSFEGIQIGTKTMSEFMKENLKLLAANMPNINVTGYKEGDYANNPYMISRGTLTPPTTTVGPSSLWLDTNIASADTITWGQVAESLGIKKGGMLTIVHVSEGVCRWLRYKFVDAMWGKNVVFGSSNISEFAAENAVEGNTLDFEDIVQFVKDGQAASENKNNFFDIDIEEGESAAVIISEKSENTWKRSTAFLQGTFEYKYEVGFATYPINTTLLLNGGKMSTNVITK